MHKMKDYANDVKLILNPVKLFPSSLPCFNFIIFFLFFILYSLIISCLFSSWVIPDIRTLKAISFESWTISFYSYFGVKIFEEEIDPFKMYTPLCIRPLSSNKVVYAISSYWRKQQNKFTTVTPIIEITHPSMHSHTHTLTTSSIGQSPYGRKSITQSILCDFNSKFG